MVLDGRWDPAVPMELSTRPAPMVVASFAPAYLPAAFGVHAAVPVPLQATMHELLHAMGLADFVMCRPDGRVLLRLNESLDGDLIAGMRFAPEDSVSAWLGSISPAMTATYPDWCVQPIPPPLMQRQLPVWFSATGQQIGTGFANADGDVGTEPTAVCVGFVPVRERTTWAQVRQAVVAALGCLRGGRLTDTGGIDHWLSFVHVAKKRSWLQGSWSKGLGMQEGLTDAQECPALLEGGWGSPFEQAGAPPDAEADMYQPVNPTGLQVLVVVSAGRSGTSRASQWARKDAVAAGLGVYEAEGFYEPGLIMVTSDSESGRGTKVGVSLADVWGCLPRICSAVHLGSRTGVTVPVPIPVPAAALVCPELAEAVHAAVSEMWAFSMDNLLPSDYMEYMHRALNMLLQHGRPLGFQRGSFPTMAVIGLDPEHQWDIPTAMLNRARLDTSDPPNMLANARNKSARRNARMIRLFWLVAAYLRNNRASQDPETVVAMRGMLAHAGLVKGEQKKRAAVMASHPLPQVTNPRSLTGRGDEGRAEGGQPSPVADLGDDDDAQDALLQLGLPALGARDLATLPVGDIIDQGTFREGGALHFLIRIQEEVDVRGRVVLTAWVPESSPLVSRDAMAEFLQGQAGSLPVVRQQGGMQMVQGMATRGLQYPAYTTGWAAQWSLDAQLTRGEQTLEVERILSHRVAHDTDTGVAYNVYMVKWVGYENEQVERDEGIAALEGPEHDMACPLLLRDYHARRAADAAAGGAGAGEPSAEAFDLTPAMRLLFAEPEPIADPLCRKCFGVMNTAHALGPHTADVCTLAPSGPMQQVSVAMAHGVLEHLGRGALDSLLPHVADSRLGRVLPFERLSPEQRVGARDAASRLYPAIVPQQREVVAEQRRQAKPPSHPAPLSSRRQRRPAVAGGAGTPDSAQLGAEEGGASDTGQAAQASAPAAAMAALELQVAQLQEQLRAHTEAQGRSQGLVQEGLVPEVPVLDYLRQVRVAQQQQAVLHAAVTRQTNATQGASIHTAAVPTPHGPPPFYGGLGRDEPLCAGAPGVGAPYEGGVGVAPLQGTMVPGSKPANMFDGFSWGHRATELEFMLEFMQQGGSDGHADRHPSHIVAAMMGYNTRLYARGTGSELRCEFNNVASFAQSERISRGSPACLAEEKAVTKLDDARSGVSLQGNQLIIQTGCSRTLPASRPKAIASRALYVEAAVAQEECAATVLDARGVQVVPGRMTRDLLVELRRSHLQVLDDYFLNADYPAPVAKLRFEQWLKWDEDVRAKLGRECPPSWAFYPSGPCGNILHRHLVKVGAVSGGGLLNPGTGGPAPHVPGPGVPRPRLTGAGGAGSTGAPGGADAPRANPSTASTGSYPNIAAFRAAYATAPPGRKSGLGCCLEHSYDGSCTRTVTEVAGFVPYCTDAAGVKRMHLCVRCTQGHAPEGLGKCSSPRKFR